MSNRSFRARSTHTAGKASQDLQDLNNTVMKIAIVRIKEAQDNVTMTFVECLGVSQEDAMEGFLWRETLGRSLGPHVYLLVR